MCASYQELVVDGLDDYLLGRVLGHVKAQLEFLFLSVLLDERRVQAGQPIRRRGRRSQGATTKDNTVILAFQTVANSASLTVRFCSFSINVKLIPIRNSKTRTMLV